MGDARSSGGGAEAGGRRRSGAETRAAIRTAARERFAADGYERATMRAIARDAGVDPSMLIRYFGSKEKLFAAAVEVDLRLPPASALPADRPGEALVAHFLNRWEGDGTLSALLRVGVTNPAGAERMRGIFAEQMIPLARELGRSSGVGEEEAERRAVLVASQVLGMALCRYVLQFPPAAGMTRDEVVGWLGPVVQGYLTGSG